MGFFALLYLWTKHKLACVRRYRRRPSFVRRSSTSVRRPSSVVVCRCLSSSPKRIILKIHRLWNQAIVLFLKLLFRDFNVYTLCNFGIFYIFFILYLFLCFLYLFIYLFNYFTYNLYKTVDFNIDMASSAPNTANILRWV